MKTTNEMIFIQRPVIPVETLEPGESIARLTKVKTIIIQLTAIIDMLRKYFLNPDALLPHLRIPRLMGVH